MQMLNAFALHCLVTDAHATRSLLGLLLESQAHSERYPTRIHKAPMTLPIINSLFKKKI